MSADAAGRAARVGGVVGLVVCLAASLVLAASTPDPAVDNRRSFVDARVGQTASSADVSAVLTGVELTRSAQRSYGDPFVSRNVLVVLDVEAAVRHRVVQFSNVYVQTSDQNRYAPRDEFAESQLSQTQPGFSRKATLVFELPDDRVPDARFVIDADGAKFDVYAAALRFDLGLSAATPVSPGPVKLAASTEAVTT